MNPLTTIRDLTYQNRFTESIRFIYTSSPDRVILIEYIKIHSNDLKALRKRNWLELKKSTYGYVLYGKGWDYLYYYEYNGFGWGYGFPTMFHGQDGWGEGYDYDYDYGHGGDYNVNFPWKTLK